MSPRGIDEGAWTVAQILAACKRTIEDSPHFGLDDALWCYAYEPRCHVARQLVYAACNAPGKKELIDWDTIHEPADRLEVLGRLIAEGPS